MLTDMYSLVDSVVGSALTIWGLVVLFNKNIPKAYFQAFSEDVEKNEALIFLTASMFLILGLIIVWVHNDWYWGPTLIVTLLGWVLTITSTAWLLLDRLVAKWMRYLAPLVLTSWFRILYGLIVSALGLLVLSNYFV